MKDTIELFKGESFRLLVIYVIPGGLVSWSYYMLTKSHGPELLELLPASSAGKIAALLFLSTIIGLVLENAGSRIEYHFWDYLNNASIQDWTDYLVQPIPTSLVAHRYISQIVTRMKFESSCSLALLLTIPATCYFAIEKLGGCYPILCVAVQFLMSIYLIFESKSSHKTLVKVRAELVKVHVNKP